VELDPAVVDVAQKCFGFVTDDRMKVTVQDGLAYIRSLASSSSSSASDETPAKRHHIIIIDVDSKDVTVGMSCPPQEFVSVDFLQTIKSLLTSPRPDEEQGVLMLNLVSRSQSVCQQVLDDIKQVFPHVIEMQMAEDVNRIVLAFPSVLKRPVQPAQIVECTKRLQNTCPKPWLGDLGLYDFLLESIITSELNGGVEDSSSSGSSGKKGAAAKKKTAAKKKGNKKKK